MRCTRTGQTTKGNMKKQKVRLFGSKLAVKAKAVEITGQYDPKTELWAGKDYLSATETLPSFVVTGYETALTTPPGAHVPDTDRDPDDEPDQSC